MITHAELSTDFDFTQRPGNKRPERADCDDLPVPAVRHWCQTQPVFQVGRCDADQPRVPRRSLRGAVKDERSAQHDEERRRDAEEPDIERADPEIEQVAADKRTPTHPIFSLEAQQRHDTSPLSLLSERRVTLEIHPREREDAGNPRHPARWKCRGYCVATGSAGAGAGAMSTAAGAITVAGAAACGPSSQL